MKKTAFAVILLTILMNSNTSFAEDSAYDEVETLRNVFQTEVSDMAINDPVYQDKVIAYSRDMLVQSPYTEDLQYFVFADRNENRQNVMVGFYNAYTLSISVLGWARISTGNPSRSRHWLTPTGIFENKISNPSFRAQGTKNAKGWRGFGVKGSRIWDFGWQRSDRGTKNSKTTGSGNIRLMMHATDPVHGEKRLGRRDSKGCVRIPAKMNKFLDVYGLIDKDYFDHPDSVASKRVLLKESERKTVRFPGRYLIVGDFEI
jgi:hypothetical protein